MAFTYFGYGSLVNDLSREVDGHRQPARINGWIRQWRHCVPTPFGNVCALTVVPRASSTIDGILVTEHVDAIDSLDKREIGYVRQQISADQVGQPETPLPHIPIYIYQSDSAHYQPPSADYPILLSYVDCVVHGFFRQYGREGVARFFASTEGWGGPIENDRSAPRYPRWVPLTPDEKQLVDGFLASAMVT